MLARTYRTPKELGITKAECDALHAWVAKARNGDFVEFDPTGDRRVDNGFDMSYFELRGLKRGGACVTVHCIAGWCDTLYNTKFQQRFLTTPTTSEMQVLMTVPPEDALPVALWEVFAGEPCVDMSLDNAIRVVEHYLQTGECCWNKCHAV